MKPQKTEKIDIKELNKSLKFAEAIDIKIQEFNNSSAKVAEKWQKKAEDMSKRTNE